MKFSREFWSARVVQWRTELVSNLAWCLVGGMQIIAQWKRAASFGMRAATEPRSAWLGGGSFAATACTSVAVGARGIETILGCSCDATYGSDSPERSWPISSGFKCYSGSRRTCGAQGFMGALLRSWADRHLECLRVLCRKRTIWNPRRQLTPR